MDTEKIVHFSSTNQDLRTSTVNDQDNCSSSSVTFPSISIHRQSFSQPTPEISDITKEKEQCITQRLNNTGVSPDVDVYSTEHSQINIPDDALLQTLTKSGRNENILEDRTPTPSLTSLPRKKKLLLLALALSNFTTMLCFSILAPFFPKEAEYKGVGSTISGWIFASFALGQFFSCPIFGKLMPIVGDRFMFLAGLFFSGGSTLLFGCMSYIDGRMEFILLCFIVRILSSIGFSAAQTASYAITGQEFSGNVGSVFGCLEIFSGLGFMVGPALGGVLYDYGGFALPFFGIGGLLILSLPLNWILLPKHDKDIHGGESNKPGELMRMLCNVRTLIVLFTVVVGATAWSAMDPTLEPHLRDLFDLSSTMVGLIFLVMAAVYAIASPIWGIAADKVNDIRIMLSVGLFISIVGLLLLGPSPVFDALGYDLSTLWVNLISLCLLGISLSMVLTPSYNILIEISLAVGMEDNMATSGIVAALWSSAYSLGGFAGSVIGGWLNEEVGFEWTMTYVSFTCIASFVSLVLLTVYDKYKTKRHNNSVIYKDAISDDEIRPILTEQSS